MSSSPATARKGQASERTTSVVSARPIIASSCWTTLSASWLATISSIRSTSAGSAFAPIA